MRAITYTEAGDPSVLELVERPVPEAGAGEVRIKVVVSGVNPTDWKTRSGLTGAPVDGEPAVPNQDGAGIVDSVGDGVFGLSVGNAVWVTLAASGRPASGTAQEYTVVPAERVFPLPGSDFELGAAVGIPAVTAHRALTVAEDGPDRLRPGAFRGAIVLVAGGAGAVGNAAIQLARWAGATVIATVSSDAKASLATAAGADHVVNYRETDAAARVRELAPDGVDLIVEVAAGANAELDQAVLRTRGTISIYANDGAAPFDLDVRRNMSLNARYQFVLLYTVGWDRIGAAAADINAAIEDGAYRVGDDAGVPIHRFALEEAAAAHAAVEGSAVGKVLITVASS